MTQSEEDKQRQKAKKFALMYGMSNARFERLTFDGNVLRDLSDLPLCDIEARVLAHKAEEEKGSK